MKEAIRVVLVDDQELYREGNALLLDATDDIVVVGEADTGEEALHAIAEATAEASARRPFRACRASTGTPASSESETG